jgi:mono/diheme cytochrome c family protein
MKASWKLTLFLIPALLLGAGCSDDGDDPTNPGDGGADPVSFAADVQPIFDNNCVGCHGDGGAAGLDLRQGVSHANLVGVAAQASSGDRVVSGDAANSVLYKRLIGDGVGLMPPGSSLGTSTIELVERWIDEGAADN